MDKHIPILLVDDSMAMRQMIKSALVELGYTNIHVASNGAEALLKIREAVKAETAYQLMFLDWNMPEMDGLTLLKICRNELGLKDAAIVMLTAISDQKSVVSALSSGANSYITKPVSVETIGKKIEQIAVWMDHQRQKA